AEKRRVGKEGRSLGSPPHLKKKLLRETSIAHGWRSGIMGRVTGVYGSAVWFCARGRRLVLALSSCACARPLIFFSSRRRHTRWPGDWSSDVCSSDLSHGHQHKDDGKFDQHWSAPTQRSHVR